MGAELRCEDCKHGPLTDRGVFHEVIGFEQPRSGGGTNAIVLRKRTGKVVCGGCIAKRKAGISPDQGTLA